MNRRINVIGIFVIFAIILISLIVPLIYFNASDSQFFNSTHKRPQEQAYLKGISPDAEDIYLVREIRKLYQEKESVDFLDTKDENIEIIQKWAYNTETYNNQVYELKNFEVIEEPSRYIIDDNFMFGYGIKSQQFPYMYTIKSHFSQLIQDYDSIKSKQSTQSTTIKNENKQNIEKVEYGLEEKTEKIIFLDIVFHQDSGIKSDKKDSKRETDVKQAEKYINYLGLDILDDWQPWEYGLMSEKAKLSIFNAKTNNNLKLFIFPTDIYENDITAFFKKMEIE